MRIKKLEIVGFKSFKDRTVIHFDAGITGVVGPNGCGKSNIVDALVWVMGEMSAKHLRGSSMEDVIFAGAEGYSPLGMAEVSLTLENEGGPFPARYARLSEIMVTRRLHRNGESLYLINKEVARLRDIQEIFMDTGAGSKGFSIIEQGAIGKIITAKPEDRRTLIEEAAGITKFKVRKRESQRKLTQTDQNLVRLQDIIGEQKRQLDGLQRQAQRAERYRQLKNEIKTRELEVAAFQYRHLCIQVEGASLDFQKAQNLDVSISSEISQKEADLAALRLEVTESEKRVEHWQQEKQKFTQEAQKRELDVRELRFEIEQARRNKEMTGNILEQYQARQQVLEKERTEYSLRQSSLSEECQAITKQYQLRQSDLEQVQKKITDADESLTLRRREMLTVSQTESHLQARQLAVQSQIEETESKVENSQEILFELQKQVQNFLERKTLLEGKLEQERLLYEQMQKLWEEKQSSLSQYKHQYTVKHQEWETLKVEWNEISSRLYGLENLQNNLEGFEDGVKAILLWQRQKDEEGSTEVNFHPLAEVVEVPAEFELAMEAVLGVRLQALVSEKTDQALAALDFLKEKKSGRSSFVIRSKVLQKENSENRAETILNAFLDQEKSTPGVRGVLRDLIQIPESYRSLVSQFLYQVVVVNQLSLALSLHEKYPHLTFVTLDGDLLTHEGVLTGGAQGSADSGVLKRRREIKDLSIQREEKSKELALLQKEWQDLEQIITHAQEDLEKTRQRLSDKEIHLVELKKDGERAENEWQNGQLAEKKQQEELSREENLLLTYRERETELNESLTEVQESKYQLEQQVEILGEELKEARKGVDVLQTEVTELKVESAAKKQELEGLNHQLNMVIQSLQEVIKNLTQMSVESERNRESLSVNSIKIEEQQLELEKIIHEIEAIQVHLSRASEEYEQIASQEREWEQELSQALHEVNENKNKLNEAQLKLEQLRMKEQFLVNQIFEWYQLNLSEVVDQFQANEAEVQQQETELVDLKDKLKRIGEVNLSAISEYDELSERFRFLSQQHQDLTDAKDQLKKVIERINRICTRRFKETFELVNERFIQVFPVLFGGGEAKLIMVEEPEQDEMGIDIVAKPPGKKLQNVGLLSGGEKALTAVSLIFSIFLVKPSPYCLLDEVDAPLDDANVFRFNDLVREMAKRSQIIVVTHNKHTMKSANKLYGVTMEEKGVSKMVTVSLHEAEKVVEA